MQSFDLGTQDTKELVAKVISGLVSQTQLEIQKGTGQAIFLVKNTPVINTAIDKASDSVRYHGIQQSNVSNEKKFAHLCFWMLKLCPISYTRRPNFFGGRFGGTEHSIDIPESFNHVPVNTHIAYKAFITFYCMNNSKDGEAAQDIESIMKNGYSKEVIRSLRFHNYSARAMAMFLEALMMDRLQ